MVRRVPKVRKTEGETQILVVEQNYEREGGTKERERERETNRITAPPPIPEACGLTTP